jgi:hypothetical protein
MIPIVVLSVVVAIGEYPVLGAGSKLLLALIVVRRRRRLLVASKGAMMRSSSIMSDG